MKLKFSFFLLLSIISNYSINAQIVDTFLVKPYLQYGTKTGMYVLWETGRPSVGEVEFTKAKLGTDSLVFDQKVTSAAFKNIHEVAIDNLEVNTKYIYRVSSTDDQGKKINGETSTFKTAVNDDDSFKFVMIGDTQRNGRTPWAWEKIAQKAWEARPDFLVLAGDLVDQGNKKTDWTEHFFPYGNVVMKRYPVYSVLGNHEQDSPNYYAYMHNPEPEYYYAFKYGNAEFFMIDTNRDVTENSEQYNWLEWALSKSKAKWKFVIHHHPPYSSDNDDHGDTNIGLSTTGTNARNLVPLLERYGVDFCLFGHTHLYERTFPILKDQINMKNGVVYINSGGAGGGLEDFDPVRNWFSAELRSTHHFCTFSVFQDQIEFKAIDYEGHVFDQIQFKKDEQKITVAVPPAPRIKSQKPIFQHETEVSMNAIDENYTIRYTLDGSNPEMNDLLYSAPIKLKESTNIKASAFDQKGNQSRVVSLSLKQMEPLPAIKLKKPQKGILYTYYEGKWKELPDFSKQNKISEGKSNLIQLEGIKHRADHFGLVYDGYIQIDETDSYTFYTYSDDGSRLFIDDQLVVDANGNHSMSYYYGTTILEKGFHKIKVEYFESTGSEGITVGTMHGEEKMPIPPFKLFTE